MSSQMSIHDEIKEQQQKTKDMSAKGKLAYFWYYYKVQTIAVVVAVIFVITFIQQYVTNKKYGFYAALVNPMVIGENNDTSVIWAEEFQEYAGIDPNEYQVYIDTSVMLSDQGASQYEISSRQKMMAMMQVGEINALVSDTETFEGYAQFEYFYDLNSIFSAEELAPYQQYLYYTDAATFETDEEEAPLPTEEERQAVYDRNIDHTDPATMEQPIAVGFCIPEKGKFSDAHYYSYLSETGAMFQGHPSQAVLGIPVTSEEPQLVLKFLEYLEIS